MSGAFKVLVMVTAVRTDKVTRRVQGSAGVVLVDYDFTKRVGTFRAAEGLMSIAGSWGWVAQIARQYGVPSSKVGK